MRRLCVFVVLFALMAMVNASGYYIDAFSECYSTARTHEIASWESVFVYGGRKNWKTHESIYQRCRIKFQADSEFIGSRLKVQVQSFTFDSGSHASLKIYDSSYSFTSDLKYTIDSTTRKTPATFTSSSDYVYIVLDRGCVDISCSSNYGFELYITTETSGSITVGGIVGIVVGVLAGLILLITVPICCVAAFKSGNRRTTGPPATITTSTPAYRTQQYNGGLSNPNYAGAYDTQRMYNPPTGQPVQYTPTAPPSYEAATANKDQTQSCVFALAGTAPYPPQQALDPTQQPPYPT